MRSRNKYYMPLHNIAPNLLQLSFSYHLYTEDSGTYDWFEVCIIPYGGSSSRVFKKGGLSSGGLEVYGWATVVIDLSAYAGQSIYVYFAVANMCDTFFKTWCYVDNVSVTYDKCNSLCVGSDFVDCVMWWMPDFEVACLAGCAIGALACGPFYPVCVVPCFGICGVVGDIALIACLLTALWNCCLS